MVIFYFVYMRKSLKAVKKFLSPIQNPIQNRNSSQIHTLNMSETKKAPNIPQLLVQNQDLKQKISILQKDNKLLQIMLHRKTIDDNSSIYRVSNQSDQLKSKDKDSFIYQQNKGIPSGRISRIKRNYQNRRSQEKFGYWNRSQLGKEGELLREEREKNRKLMVDMMKLRVRVDNHTRQKKQMLEMIQQLRDKLKQSTQYILKMQRPQSDYTLANKIQQQLKSPHNRNSSPQNNNNQQNEQKVDEMIEQYKRKLGDYFETKNENYKLRDQITHLILRNKILEERVSLCTNAVDHLWAVKDIEMENIRMCVRELKGSM